MLQALLLIIGRAADHYSGTNSLRYYLATDVFRGNTAKGPPRTAADRNTIGCIKLNSAGAQYTIGCNLFDKVPATLSVSPLLTVTPLLLDELIVKLPTVTLEAVTVTEVERFVIMRFTGVVLLNVPPEPLPAGILIFEPVLNCIVPGPIKPFVALFESGPPSVSVSPLFIVTLIPELMVRNWTEAEAVTVMTAFAMRFGGVLLLNVPPEPMPAGILAAELN